jgi:hypothetical protein
VIAGITLNLHERKQYGYLIPHLFGTGPAQIILVLFHLAGCRGINPFVTSPDGDAKPDTAAYGHKDAGDDADPDNVMY